MVTTRLSRKKLSCSLYKDNVVSSLKPRHFSLHSYGLYPPSNSFVLIAVSRHEPIVFLKLIRDHLVSGQYDTTSY
jgi:hypothetical protein